MNIHFVYAAVIMFGAGTTAFITGGILTMTFDVSGWLPTLGTILATLGIITAVLAVGIQVGAWAGIH